MIGKKVVVVCDNENIKSGSVCEVLKERRGKVLCLAEPGYDKPQWYLIRQVVPIPERDGTKNLKPT